MQLGWLPLAIACTVGYHLVLKVTPAAANPWLSLFVTYALVTLLFGVLLLASPGGFEWRHEIRQLNWTALALAAFKEKLSAANAVGLVLCLVGLWLVNRR